MVLWVLWTNEFTPETTQALTTIGTWGSPSGVHAMSDLSTHALASRELEGSMPCIIPLAHSQKNTEFLLKCMTYIVNPDTTCPVRWCFYGVMCYSVSYIHVCVCDAGVDRYCMLHNSQPFA